MDDFGAPATLPDVSRKRPRYDDQIAEYRASASKRHADVLSESLADAADAAATELSNAPQGDIDTRLEEDTKAFREQVQEHLDELDEERRLYPGPLRRLSRPTAEERKAPVVTITQAHSNPLAGVENVRMTLRNRLAVSACNKRKPPQTATYRPGVIFRRVHGPGVIFGYSPTPGVIFGQKGTLCDNF